MDISVSDYLKALKSKDVLNERRRLVLNAICSTVNYKASPAVIAELTGKNIHFVNLIFGSLAKAIAGKLNIERNTKEFNSPQWWPVISAPVGLPPC
jgi:hypothetical protein